MIVRELVTLLGYDLDTTKLATYENKTTNVLDGLAKAARLVKTAIAAVGVYRLGRGFISAAASMEQTTIAFETLLGSQDKAKSMVDDLMQMAAITPYSETDMINGAKLFLNYGVAAEKVLPIMSQLSDVASGSAQKLYSLSLNMAQTMATGRLLGGDLRSMVNAGFNPLQEISRTTGESMASLTKKMGDGKISVDMVLGAFKSATSKGGRFFNMSIKQSKTFSGMMSTAGDYLKGMARTIGAELLPPAKAVLSVFMDFLETNKTLITKIAVGAFKALAIAIAYAVIFVDELIKALGGTDKIFGWVAEQVDTFLVGLKAIWNVLKQPIIKYLVTALAAMALAWKSAAIAQAIFNAVSAVNPITWMILAIVALIFALGLLLKNWDKISAFFKKTLTKLGAFFKRTFDSIVAKLKNVWQGVAEFFLSIWTSVKTTAISVWTAIANFVVNVWFAIKDAASRFGQWLVSIWEDIKTGASVVWEAVKAAGVTAWSSIQVAWNAAAEFFSTIWSGIEAFGTAIWTGIVAAAAAGWEGIKLVWSVVSGFFKAIWDAIQLAGSAIWGLITAAASAGVTGLQKAWSGVKEFFSSIWDGIKTGADGVFTWLKDGFQAAADWVTGIWDGVKTFFDTVWERIAKFGEVIQNIFKALGINLVAKETIETQTTDAGESAPPIPTILAANGFPGKGEPIAQQGAPLPRYARGTDFVPQTGAAVLERGEAVLPPGVLEAFVQQKRDTAKIVKATHGVMSSAVKQAMPAINIKQPKSQVVREQVANTTVSKPQITNIYQRTNSQQVDMSGIVGSLYSGMQSFMKSAIGMIKPAAITLPAIRERVNERVVGAADRSISRSTTSSINVDSTIKLSVPVGTPEVQITAVQKAAEKAVQDQWTKILRHTATQFTPLEAGG